MSEGTIRPATLTDLPLLLELEQNVIDAERPFNEHIREQAHYYNLNDLIARDNALLACTEQDGSITACGYIDIRQSRPCFSHEQHGYLGFMYVSPEHRGQGLNQKLIGFLVDWAKAKSVEVFFLDVYSQNQAAIRAYEKIGFQSSMIEMKLSL